MRRLLTSLALVGFGLLLALAGVEVLLRVFAETLPPSVAANAGIDTPSNIGVERFRRAWQNSLTTDATLGMRAAPNLDVQLEGHPDFSFRLRTNGHGFRNRYTEGPVDVVAIGDSFTFGYGVDDDEAWPALLEQRTGRSVANLGQVNYGPQAELQVLAAFGLPMQPKLVIWQFFANDFLDASMYLRWQQAGAPDYFQWESQQATEGRAENSVPQSLSGVRGLLHRHLVSYELVKYVLGVGSYRAKRAQQVPVRVGNSRSYLNQAQLDGWSNPDWPAVAGGRELTEAALLDARQQAEAAGAAFVVVLLPSKEEAYAARLGAAAGEDPWARQRNGQQITAFCKRNRLTCLDLQGAIEQAVEDGVVPYFQHDGHLNEVGHELVAEAVAEMLAQTGM